MKSSPGQSRLMFFCCWLTWFFTLQMTTPSVVSFRWMLVFVSVSGSPFRVQL